MGFMNIFWGLLFFFDIRINNFDILPDIIGFILIIVGLNKLKELNENFKKSYNIAIPLMIMSILYFIPIRPSGFTILISIVGLILRILLIYNICLGISELANMSENKLLSEKAMKRYNAYLIIQIIAIIAMIIALVAPILMLFMFIPLFIALLVIFIQLMGLMKQAEEELSKTI